MSAHNRPLTSNEQAFRALLLEWIKACPNPPEWHWTFDLHIRTVNTLGERPSNETGEPPLSAIELAQQLGSWFDLKIPLIEREQKVARLVVAWANQRNTQKASEGQS